MQSITKLQADLPVLAIFDLLNKAVQLSNEYSSADPQGSTRSVKLQVSQPRQNNHFGL